MRQEVKVDQCCSCNQSNTNGHSQSQTPRENVVGERKPEESKPELAARVDQVHRIVARVDVFMQALRVVQLAKERIELSEPARVWIVRASPQIQHRDALVPLLTAVEKAGQGGTRVEADSIAVGVVGEDLWDARSCRNGRSEVG